ncbi:hypothetical protein E0M25_15535 [Bacillus mycoides]|uniref:hypothetical protein n=1 Tax=Bacillus mycoides TaxID=1405 RepID=UPI00103CCC53|nr:hypothetical protein [Bacillus mycoides]TBX75972.1 hypothetical protein E0M25_15535 [Bacillus mycoides]
MVDRNEAKCGDIYDFTVLKLEDIQRKIQKLKKIKQYVKNGLTPNPVELIRENIRENRCGCEVNNPQGSCCLGNVITYIRKMSLGT